MPERNRIDFLLIGAQKSGTTSLYKHLSAHAQVYLPRAKEVEFFSDDRRFARGVDWYWTTYFSAAPKGTLVGEASTHYMMYPHVAERIYDAFPQVQLLAILRNPIDRTYSHHRMSVMRGEESRSFRECVNALLAEPRREETPFRLHHDYLRFGEYGRILTGYLNFFPRNQLCVLFAEDLDRDPASVVRRAYAHIGVDDTFLPDTLGRRFNVGGMPRVRGLDHFLRRVAGRVRRLPLLDRVITQDRFDAFKFWSLTQANVVPRASAGPPAEVRSTLVEYFATDVRRLEETLGIRAPWPEFHREAPVKGLHPTQR